jgi:hypothetical protein
VTASSRSQAVMQDLLVEEVTFSRHKEVKVEEILSI